MELCERENVQFSEITSFIKFPRKTELLKYKAALPLLDKSSAEEVNDFLKRFAWVTTHAFSGKPLSKKDLLQEQSAEGILETQEKAIAKNLPPQFLEIVRIASELSFYRSNLLLKQTAALRIPIGLFLSRWRKRTICPLAR